MDVNIQIGCIDCRQDTAWTGLSLYNKASDFVVDPMKLQALRAEMDKASDGKHYAVKIVNTNRYAFDVADLGESFVEYTAHLQVRPISGGDVVKIAIHAVKDEAVEKPEKTGRGAVVPYLKKSYVTDILTALAGVLGFAGGAKDFLLVANYITESQR